ncbi:MAG TPA: winged helix-turn-helix domain-containing protein, partial [Pseudonocardiaceae bacterium]|nr:winged helix-turn-helix domain-containing protein [Pseudonocardiaceae bacterium]
MAASVTVETVGQDSVRRTALAAQGFADPRPTGVVTRRHLARVLGRIRLLQLDSVTE